MRDKEDTIRDQARETDREMAACSCGVAVLGLLFFTPAVMLLASAPCAAAAASTTVLPVTDLPRAGGGTPPYFAEGAGNKGDGSNGDDDRAPRIAGVRRLEDGGALECGVAGVGVRTKPRAGELD